LANTVQHDRPVTDMTRCSWCGDDPAMIAYHNAVQAGLSAALTAHGFKSVGQVNVHAWMQAVGMVKDHAPDCLRLPAVRTRI